MSTIRIAAFTDESAASVEDQISALKRNGINLTEIRTVGKKNVSELTSEEGKECYRKLSGEGCAVWSVGSPLGKVDINVDFDEYAEVVKRVCETANNLHTDKVRAFSFYNAYDKSERVTELLYKMVDIAKEFGVSLYHENEKDIYGDTLQRVCEIREKVKGLKFVYDPANFIQVGEKADDTLPALFSSTDYFHIKDVITQTGELVPAGYGDGQIGRLIDMVDKDVTFTVEPHLAVFDAYAKIDGTPMKNKFRFTSAPEAFDFAVSSLKELLVKHGYKQAGCGSWKK